MKRITALLGTLLLFVVMGYSQVAINDDGSDPDASAMLDIKSVNRGLLLPRMTTIQISSISNPAAGLLVYNTDSSDFYGYNGSKWISLWNTGDTLADWYCGNQIIDTRDGQNYSTVRIATQCWMAENLNIGTMISGNSNQTNNGTIERYCYYNSTTSCDTYGGLYQWDEMMQYTTTEGAQGICPTGWHVPTDDEWKTLEMYLGMSQAQTDATGWRGTDEGGKLKETGTTHWNSPNTGATNYSGFLAIAGGSRSISGLFHDLKRYAIFWTSSEDGADAWRRYLYYDNSKVLRQSENKAYGLSVRCIKG